MPDFYTVVTDIGLQALGFSTQGQSFSLTHAVVGDGNGLAVIPNKGMTTLVNEVWRGNVAGITVDPNDSNTHIFEFVIPANTGGFTVREVGLLDENGTLYCIGNFPETEKPVAADGSVRDLVIRLPLHFENADVVNLVINPAIALATKQDVLNHNADPQAHRFATTAATGFVRLATDEEHRAHLRKTVAATPWGVWLLIEALMSDAVDIASSLRLATSQAVKIVMDALNGHKAASDPHDVVAKVKALLSSSIANASSTTFATPLAVKTVYDKLVEHKNAVDPHGIVAKIKALLSSSVTSTSTTTPASSKAVKTAYDAGTRQATEIQKGQAEIATQAEVDTGADDTRFVTAKKLLDLLTRKFLKLSGGTMTGHLELAYGAWLKMENGNHCITNNDGKGNFNIRVGHDAAEKYTTAGGAVHLEFSHEDAVPSFNIHMTPTGSDNVVGAAANFSESYTFGKGGNFAFNGNRFFGKHFRPTWDDVTNKPTLLSTVDFPCSKSATGWQQLPSGIIIQWGKLIDKSMNQTFHPVTFPIAFPHAALNVSATISRSKTISGTVATVVRNLTQTGVEIAGDYDTNTGTGDFMWFAIGY